jgi:hypothetical protein
MWKGVKEERERKERGRRRRKGKMERVHFPVKSPHETSHFPCR